MPLQPLFVTKSLTRRETLEMSETGMLAQTTRFPNVIHATSYRRAQPDCA